MAEKSEFKKKLGSLIEGDYDWSQETQLDGMRRAFHLLETDPRPALNELRALADKGSLTSALNLGHYFASGRYVAKNLVEAEKWYRLAADQGPIRYTHYLGRFYLESDQRVKAIRALRTAVDQGYVPSMIVLAHTLSRGSEFERDHVEARRLLEMARRAGSLPATVFLGGVLLREWYNPLRLVRGLWLIIISLPALNALIGDEKDLHTSKSSIVFRVAVWAAALVIGLVVGALWLFVFLGFIMSAVKAPLWAAIPLYIAAIAGPVALSAFLQRRQRKRAKVRLSGWPFRG